jgi:hypothetical protein
MAWKAYLESLNEEPVPTNILIAIIRYEETGTGRTVQKSYTLTVGMNADITSVRRLVTAELLALEDVTPVKDSYAVYIGREIPRLVN